MTKFILFNILIILNRCISPNDKHIDAKILDHQHVSLRIEEILSFNFLQNTQLLISRDTVFFITPDYRNKPLYCSISAFYFEREKNQFHFRNISSSKPYSETRKVFNSLTPDLVINPIGDYKYEFDKLQNEFKNDDEIKDSINANTIVQFFKRKYYLINKFSPKRFTVYDPIENKTKLYKIGNGVMDVTGFFVFDIDKDSHPELCILNVGNVPRPEWISFTIYSIRKDSAAVQYE